MATAKAKYNPYLFSGGKDSVVTLDLCNKYFKEVIKVPHPMLVEWLRYGLLRGSPDFNVPLISFLDVYTYLRVITGIWWIAAGERINDSIVRRAMIKQGGGSVNDQRGRFFPVAYWDKADIVNYIKLNRLKTSPESQILGFSFRSLMPADMAAIKEHYPKDYAALEEWFPLLGASLAKHNMFGKPQEKAVAYA